MIELCKAGSREARDTLIERNLRLVAHIVKKYATGERDNDDLISIGTIGLIKAIDSFNPDKNIRLATYAARCIDNELLMMLRSSRKQAREIYLNDSIGCDKEGNEINLLDIIESVDEDVAERMEREENIGKLQGLLDKVLTGRERIITCLRYGIPMQSKELLAGIPVAGWNQSISCTHRSVVCSRELTQREIAVLFGISRSYVSRIEKKALQKLKMAYLAEYNSNHNAKQCTYQNL